MTNLEYFLENYHKALDEDLCVLQSGGKDYSDIYFVVLEDDKKKASVVFLDDDMNISSCNCTRSNSYPVCKHQIKAALEFGFSIRGLGSLSDSVNKNFDRGIFYEEDEIPF